MGQEEVQREEGKAIIRCLISISGGDRLLSESLAPDAALSACYRACSVQGKDGKLTDYCQLWPLSFRAGISGTGFLNLQYGPHHASSYCRRLASAASTPLLKQGACAPMTALVGWILGTEHASQERRESWATPSLLLTLCSACRIISTQLLRVSDYALRRGSHKMAIQARGYS